jgi:hypothetical protein
MHQGASPTELSSHRMLTPKVLRSLASVHRYRACHGSRERQRAVNPFLCLDPDGPVRGPAVAEFAKAAAVHMWIGGVGHGSILPSGTNETACSLNPRTIACRPPRGRIRLSRNPGQFSRPCPERRDSRAAVSYGHAGRSPRRGLGRAVGIAARIGCVSSGGDAEQPRSIRFGRGCRVSR